MVTERLPFAYGGPVVEAVLRADPSDFQVEEVLGYEPEGEGEHVYLWVEKSGLNTQFVADRLADFAQLPRKAVSFSGMKDRHAVTWQWFGVHMPGKQALDWSSLNNKEMTVLKAIRHPRKLRRGVHRGNRFLLTLTNCKGDFDALLSRLEQIRERGFPNYFGEQRFGHGGKNLANAQRWFDGGRKPKRQQQSIYLSAVRSFLFNEILAQRVKDKSWNSALAGDVLMLNGSHSLFVDNDLRVLDQRLADGDIHITGPLYGSGGKPQAADAAAVLESGIFAQYQSLTSGLEQQQTRADRRALRAFADQLQWTVEGDRLSLNFFLPSGCFATALVRELADYKEPPREAAPDKAAQ
jgi:tRNA pseudouridine13 synthase